MTPANGENKIAGKVENSRIRENIVTDPVSLNTQTPKANDVNPDPTTENNCPNQTIKNVLKPPVPIFHPSFSTQQGRNCLRIKPHHDYLLYFKRANSIHLETSDGFSLGLKTEIISIVST